MACKNAFKSTIKYKSNYFQKQLPLVQFFPAKQCCIFLGKILLGKGFKVFSLYDSFLIAAAFLGKQDIVLSLYLSRL